MIRLWRWWCRLWQPPIPTSWGTLWPERKVTYYQLPDCEDER
jgi:hypothetical protein